MRNGGLGRGLESLLDTSAGSRQSLRERVGVQLFLEPVAQSKPRIGTDAAIPIRSFARSAYILWGVDVILVMAAFILLTSSAVGKTTNLGIGSLLIGTAGVVGVLANLLSSPEQGRP